MNRQRGWNLRAGEPHGDRGRSLGGQAHAARNGELLDDSGCTLAQYWGWVGWLKLVEQHGEDGARAVMSERGQEGWRAEMRDYAEHLWGSNRYGV